MPSKLGVRPSFERRNFPRREVNMQVRGKRLDHSISARRMPFLNLSLRDLSVGGCSASIESPMDAGERISIYFPANGISSGWDAYGRVLRCEQSSIGYRIAVEFESLPAA
jgi:hypothetical protein